MNDKLPNAEPCPKCGGVCKGPRFVMGEMKYDCTTCGYSVTRMPLDEARRLGKSQPTERGA